MNKFSTSPYPGLRSFRPDESDIFFGREEQTDRLLERLQRSHFLAVVGPSGCGKSSLVRAGMIAALETGFMADAGSRWRIAEMRPGDRPIRRLARALSSSQAPERGVSAEGTVFLEATLRRGPLGLTEMLQETPLPAQTNLLLLVDQFEEIFRFREKGDPDEADAFVALLLATSQQSKAQVYVVITMRSDFLGDCTLFKGLPEAINESQYLTPRLTREQCRAAIVGPAKVCGGDLEPALVNRLVNDFGPDPDQLPLLQHALMRMWTRVTERIIASAEKTNETLLAVRSSQVMLTVRDYEALGGLSRALSDHADEVFRELTDSQRKIAEIMFRRLTERGVGRRDTRAPARLSDVAAVAEVSAADVIAVVEAFRRPDRCFVTPLAEMALTPDTLLDIGHESLIRQWRLLGKWVEEEGNSALMYRRLNQTAQLWKAGEAALWRNPDLARALRWEQTQHPSPAWAIRYGSAEEFALATEFLRASERVWSEEQRQAERQRSLWHRILGTAAVVLLIVATVFAGFAISFKKQYDAITYYKQFTVLRPLYSAATPGSADRNILFACQKANELIGRKNSIDPLFFGDIISVLNRALDRRGRLVETHWNYQFPASKEVPGDHFSVSAVAYSPDGRTLVLGDSEGRVRVLRNGILSDPLPIPGERIWTLAFSPDGSRVAVGTARGFVSIFDPSDAAPMHTVVDLAFPGGEVPIIWSCSWNEQGDLAAAGQDGKIYLWLDLLHVIKSGSLPSPICLENRVNGKLTPVHAVAWNHASSMLAMGDALGNLRLWDRMILSDPTKAHSEAIWSVAWSRDGRLACGSWDHSISIWKIETTSNGSTPLILNRKEQAHDQWVRDVAWIDNDQTIASVGDDGMLKFRRSSDLTDLASEQSPTTTVWKLSYSESTKMIATGNYDGSVRIFQLAPPSPREVFGNNVDAVIRLAFSDSKVLSFDSEGRLVRFDSVSLKEEDKTQIQPGFQSGIVSVRFQPQIKAFVIGYDNKYKKESSGTLVVWNLPPDSRLTSCKTKEAIRLVDCHPTKAIVAFLTKSGTLGLRTLPDLQLLSGQADFPLVQGSKPGIARGVVAWSHSGDTLLVALTHRDDNDENSSEIRRFHFDGKALSETDPIQVVRGQIYSVLWHPSDQLIAIGTASGAIILHWLTGLQTDPIFAHDGKVTTLTWSLDGRRLFTGGIDGSVKVWDYNPDGKNKLTLAITLRHETGGIYATGVSPDRKGIYTAGDSAGMFFWPEATYSVRHILDRARKMVNRNMFGSEWIRYTQSDLGEHPAYQRTFDDLPALSQSESR
jgi:WD40 repeat protein